MWTFIEIDGWVYQTSAKEDAQIVVAFIDGIEAGRVSVVFDGSSKKYKDTEDVYKSWQIDARADPRQWPKRRFNGVTVAANDPQTIQGPYKSISIRSFTNLDPMFASEKLQLQDGTSSSNGIATPGVKRLPTLGERFILLLISVASGLLSYGFLCHFIPEVLPQAKDSRESAFISNGAAGLLSLLFAVFLVNSDSAHNLIAAITGGLMTVITSAFSIIFLMISSFLFWKRIKAYLS